MQHQESELTASAALPETHHPAKGWVTDKGLDSASVWCADRPTWILKPGHDSIVTSFLVSLNPLSAKVG